MNGKLFLDRKTLATTIATAGLGLGMIVTLAHSASDAGAQEATAPALAQEEVTPEEGEIRERLRSGEMREELYGEFTTALADELGVDNSDEVDAAIRVAMMTVVDTRVDDGLLTAGQAEALKTLIATSDVPLGPGTMFSPPHGAIMRTIHEHAGEAGFLPMLGGNDHWTIHVNHGLHGDHGKGHDVQFDDNVSDDAQENEGDDEASS